MAVDRGPSPGRPRRPGANPPSPVASAGGTPGRNTRRNTPPRRNRPTQSPANTTLRPAFRRPTPVARWR
eukprot:10888121-Lingulodinium_polyedra.AAC.1